MSGVDVGGEEGVEEVEGGLVLAASGAEKAGEDGEGVSASLGARAERDFARDDRAAKSAFGEVVGRGHAGSCEEGKEFLCVALRR